VWRIVGIDVATGGAVSAHFEGLANCSPGISTLEDILLAKDETI
jgi:hypothetical protein